MTRTVGSIFGRRPDPSTIEGHPMVVGTGRVGIEIELEGVRDSRGFRSPYWTVKGDGSLRNNGLEFVFSGPFGGVDLHNATLVLDSFLFDKNPDGSRRCSTHVHVDVREMTVPQLRRYALGYLVYEKFLFRMSGIHRYNNNFCPAIGFAQHQLEVLGQAFRHINDNDCVNHIVGNWDKYSAMNFLPIAQFGSVEFRISEAKWRKGLLIRLCNRFLSLKELAKSWTGTEREFVDYLA
ncbi:MAG: amidoligase family protein, partial [Bacteroidales bacterium]